MSEEVPILESRDAGRRADGDNWLFRHIHLQLWPGECLALMGPSGAGKSLLLRTLSLLDCLDEGEVLWHNASVPGHRIPEFRGRIIYLQQHAFTVEGNVEDNLRIPFSFRTHKRNTWSRQRVLSMLSVAGQSDTFLQRKHQDLSGGEKQLVAFVRILQLDPDAMLLDEPTSAMDETMKLNFEQLVHTWRAQQPEQRALVWVSHDLRQLQRQATRQIKLENGHVVAEH